MLFMRGDECSGGPVPRCKVAWQEIIRGCLRVKVFVRSASRSLSNSASLLPGDPSIMLCRFYIQRGV